MSGKELFENIRRHTINVTPNRKIDDFLNRIALRFVTAEISYDLINTGPSGQRGKDNCHILFICEKMLYEIIYSDTSMEFSSSPVSEIDFISIKANNDQQSLKGRLSGNDELKLTISCGEYTMEYHSSSVAFDRILGFRDKIWELKK
jgi:hypothetical protein